METEKNEPGIDYEHWAELYEESVHELSEATWKEGILAELKRLSIEDGKILDAGAGTGIGVKLLKLHGGFEVTAVDRNQQMLDRLNEESIKVLCADLTTLPNIEDSFQAIVSGFDTINYLDKNGLETFLQWSADHLEHEGVVIFDYSTPRLLQETWRNLSYEQPLSDGKVLKWTHKWDSELKQSKTVLELWHDGARLWEETHIQHGYDTYELYEMAKKAGLMIEKIRCLDSEVFTPDTGTWVVVMKVTPKTHE